ncbi:exodeoxyribonuclease I [Marinibactrum halimedae]|uniref:Exodeoxyribonuclease I n=1 Tax=Marinibactrum halimedae TaxID=1444977 RepID=A0AA37TEL1_9GAMM|nr:exodeoxyribonuclease I [Marinibactrum halimedae]MCD9457986.1 exodeoxyribonuclease I [Marinibactrum halimedae]GLS27612.1 exodeoxyribonuclease I [Marinibactrum halimedae]
MNTFYWHDYETWGANPALDRPSQFAGIRTDESLNVIGDPLVMYCRPTPDFLPHPEACLVTGITPQQALSEGVSEVEFIRRIHEEMATPGTCTVGYNSIRFDDEVTRYTLWRNFYDPYEREWQNGNSRWDIIDMVRLAYAIRPDGIEWPTHDSGKPSFRLEDITAANGIGHESAHDALSDVMATIAVARLIKDKQPKLFDYLHGLRNKKRVLEMIDIEGAKPLLHISSRFPAERGCAALVLPLAMHPVNKNAVIVYDLSVSPEALLNCSAETIREKLYTPTHELAEGESRIPLKLVHVNKCPVLATPKLLDESSAERLGISLYDCRRHWQQMRAAQSELFHNLVEKMQSVFTETREFNQDADSALYGGFLGGDDKRLAQQVREASADELVSRSWPFEDARLKELFWRYRARNFPEVLGDEEQRRWAMFCLGRLTDAAQGGVTIDALQERIFELQETQELTPSQLYILESLSNYGDELVSYLY